MKILKDYIIITILLLLIVSYLFYNFIGGSFLFTSADSLSPLAVKQSIKFYIDLYGEFPYWFPSILGGMPTINSFLYIADFYLPHKVMMFLYDNGLPWVWNFIFHLVFGALGTYSLLIFLRQSRLSSLFGSILFLLMPYMITMMVYGHGSQMMSAAYIPWIILLLFKIYKKMNLFDIGIFSFLIGLQLQRGHIQIAYYSWMMIGLFSLISMTPYFIKNKFEYYTLLKTKVVLFSSLFTGLLLSLSIYLPVLNYSSLSIRGATGGGAGIQYATQWSMSIKELLTLIFPYSLGFGGQLYYGDLPFTDFPNYIGITIIFLSIIGLHKSKLEFIYKVFFSLVVILSLLISLGHNFIDFYNLFYNYMPYFNKFRVPAYILILTNFSVIIVASCGLDIFIKSINNHYSKNIFNYIIIFSIIMLAIIYRFLGQGLIPSNIAAETKALNLIINDSSIIISISIILLIAYFCFNIKKFKSQYLYYIIILLFTYDYYRIDKEIINPNLHIPHKEISKSTSYLEKYLYEDQMIKTLKSDTSKFRIYDYLGQGNRWSIFGIESINGYHPAKLNNYSKFIENIQIRGYELWPEGILELLNIKYLVLPNNKFNHSSFTNLGNQETTFFGNNLSYDGKLINVNLYYYKNSLDRVFFTNKIEYLDVDKIYNLIISEQYDPLDVVYLIGKENNYVFDASNRSVELTSWSPNEIKFNTFSNSDQFLVMSEVFYNEGWSLYSDGVQHEILEVNNLVRGINIPKGQHDFTMRFKANDLNNGIILSRIGYLIIIIIFLIYLYRKKKNARL